MSENENNNFESLRRLLVIKQHETPPPGYFNYFSSQVVHRIRAGDTGSAAGWLEDLYGEAPWMGKLLQVFSVKPVFASAFAGALCLLLVFGIIYAERPDMAPQPLLQTAVTATPTASFASAEPMSLAQSPDAGGLYPAPIQCSVFSRLVRFLASKVLRSSSPSACPFPAIDPI